MNENLKKLDSIIEAFLDEKKYIDTLKSLPPEELPKQEERIAADLAKNEILKAKGIKSKEGFKQRDASFAGALGMVYKIQDQSR